MNADSGKNYTQEELAERTIAMKDKMAKLMEDEAFVEKLMNTEEPEDVQKLFAQRDVELSIDEIKAMGKLLERAADNGGELSEEALEEVAGGIAPVIIAEIIAVAVTASGTTLLVDNARRVGNFFRRVFSRW